jgi:hypothetical protein
MLHYLRIKNLPYGEPINAGFWNDSSVCFWRRMNYSSPVFLKIFGGVVCFYSKNHWVDYSFQLWGVQGFLFPGLVYGEVFQYSSVDPLLLFRRRNMLRLLHPLVQSVQCDEHKFPLPRVSQS